MFNAQNKYAQNQYAIGAPSLKITSASLSSIEWLLGNGFKCSYFG